MIFSETDVCDLIMQGRDLSSLSDMIVDASVDLDSWPDFILVRCQNSTSPNKEIGTCPTITNN
jgi:hypothetical protein